MREREFLESWNKCTMKMRRQNRCSNVGSHQMRRVTKCQLSGGSRVLATLWYKVAGVRSGSTENKVVQGSKYSTIDAVKEAVKLWSLSLRKEFRVVKSSSSTY